MPEVANLQVVVSADTSAAERGLSDLGTKVNSAGSALQTALGGAAIAAVAGLGAAFVGSVNSAMDFEKQMSAISAVTGASAAEMEALTATALQLGKDTSFSAKEAAQGIEELVKAGVSVEDAIGGGARAALDLAAAGAISVGDAAEIASNAMNVFNLSGGDMGHVADVIAGAANASAISVNDYKFSLAAAGAVASTVGIGFESLSEAIAVMGQAGIKGSDAGTSLKTMMMNLIPSTNKQKDLFRELGLITFDVQRGLEGAAKLGIQPATQDLAGLSAAMMDSLGLSRDTATWTKKQEQQYEELSSKLGLTQNAFFDATGKARSFSEIAQVLQDALKGMTKEQQLATLEVMFGSDAIRAGAVMMEAGAQGFTDMAEAMSKVTAQAVAEERLNNLAGSLEKLKGSVETAMIIFGGLFTPILKGWVDTLTEYVNQGIEILEKLPKAWDGIVEAFTTGDIGADALAGFTDLFGDFGTTVQAALMMAGNAFRTLQPALDAFGSWLSTHTELIYGLGVALLSLMAAQAVVAVISGIGAAIALLTSPIGLVVGAIAILSAAWIGNWGGIQEKTAAVWAYLEPTFTALAAWLGEKIPPLLDWIATVGWPALVSAGTAVADFVTGTLIPALTTLAEWLGPKLVDVCTWISETGWPALVAAGEAVYGMVQVMHQWFTDLFVALEQRGVFTELQALWRDLTTIAASLWQTIQLVWDWLTKVNTAAGETTSGPAARAVDWFKNLGQAAYEAAGGVDAIARGFGNFIRDIRTGLGWIQQLIDKLNRLIGKQKEAASRSEYSSRESRELAHGGIISEPVVGYGLRSGARYSIGEAGPEAVVPLGGSSGGYGGAAGGMTGLVVNVNVYGSALASRQEIADAVVVGLSAAQQQGRTRLSVV